ncbi:sulfotransferase domain-containing protein [Cryomorphaceae bacterium 1068]|nr:sulfotransferase domain-containing protein [Cryomorphaceae bacterium 1068]
MFNYDYKGQTYRLPDFIIPGAAKSGTTTLYQLLSQHPDLFFPPSRKEPFYFSFGGDKPTYTDEKFNAIPIWQTQKYLELFDSAKSSHLCGEASTSYLYTYDKSLKLLHDFYGQGLKDLKSLIILRNPVDRAYSHYTYLIRNGFENRTFEDAISEKGISEWKNKRWGFDYLAYGKYADQVSAFKSAIPQTKVWLLEDLKKGSETTDEMLNFLGVPLMQFDTSMKANPSGIPKSKGLVNLLRKNPVAQKIGKALPSSLQSNLKNKRDKLMSRLLTKEPMKPETRKELTSYFREDIEKLQEVMDRDLKYWLDN